MNNFLRFFGFCLIVFGSVINAYAEWELVDSPGAYILCDVSFVDKENGIICGTHENKIIYTKDGGENWEKSEVEDEDKIGIQCLDFVTKEIAWAGGYYDNPRKYVILKSMDGGKTWKIQQVPENMQAFRIHFVDENKGWILPYGGGIIWNTTDGGKTWNSISFKVAHKDITCHPGMYVFDFENVIIAGFDGIIVKTNDCGATWKAIQVDKDVLFTSISFCDKNIGWAVGWKGFTRTQSYTGGEKGAIYRTKDGGESWEEQEHSYLNNFEDVWAISSNEAWVAGTVTYHQTDVKSGVLLHTLDGGSTWKNENPVSTGIKRLFFINDDDGWGVGGWGGSPYESIATILHYVK